MNMEPGADKRDWLVWHRQYEDECSPLGLRLSIVRREIRRTLPPQSDSVLSILSVCAGQGDDLIPVLQECPYVSRIRVRLVELDKRNIKMLRDKACAAGLHHLEIVHADASYTDAYQGIVPVDLLLLCGVFGNISHADIQYTISCLPQLCRKGSKVIWTRSRRSPDMTPTIRQWFADNAFHEITFEAPADVLFSVGTHEFCGEQQQFLRHKLFTFI
jgi:hypothetical protein